MNSDLIGEGIQGEVRAGTFAVKEYHNTNFYLDHHAIREVSFMKYLNDLGIQGVPIIHSVITTTINRDEVRVSSIMNMAGRSLESILDQIEDVEGRCEVVERYFDKIVNVIKEIHRAGVIHNDLNLGNILIDVEDGNRVNIIDFAISTFNDAYELYDVSHFTPEFYLERRNYYATDYWLLAVSILNACLGYSYVPNTESDWHEITEIIEPEYDLDQLEKRASTRVIIPPEITDSLAEKLRPMLEFNINDRRVPIPRSELELSRFKVKIPGITKNVVSYMAQLFKHYFQTHPSRLGVAIDVLKRVIIMMEGFPQTSILMAELLMSIVLIVSDTTDLIEDLDHYELNVIRVNNFTPSNISKRIIRILKLIDWKVYTRTNVELSNIGNIIDVCDKVIEDENSSRLINMSDHEIYLYFRGIIN